MAGLIHNSKESSASRHTEEVQKEEKSKEAPGARRALLINPTTIKDDPVDSRYLPFFMLNDGELLMDVSKIDSYEESVIEHISDALGEFNKVHHAGDPIEVPHVSNKHYVSDVHVPAQFSASSSSSTRLITTENQFKSGAPPQQSLHRSSSELGSEDSLCIPSANSLKPSDALFPAHHHHNILVINNNPASAAAKKIETSCPKYNYTQDRALQAPFPDRAGILNNYCPIESPSILPTRAVSSETCSEDIMAMAHVGRLSSSPYHHLQSALPSSSDSDPANDAEPMSAAISRLLLNNPNKFKFDDDDDNIDLTFAIAHLNLDSNTPIAPRSNAPWMVDGVHGFSSEAQMAPSSSWGGKREDLRDDSLNAFGSYSHYSSPQPAWPGHKRRNTTGIQSFLPAATYVTEEHSSPFSRASSDGYRNVTPFGLRGLYDSGSEAELGPVPPHIVAAQQQQQQYYRYRQGSLSSSIASTEPFFNSPERNPGLSAYVPTSYSDHGHHPLHRTTASGPNPSRLTNEGVYGSVEGHYPNVNVNTARPGHRSSLSQSSTTSTSRHSDSHSQKSSALSTASSSPPQPSPNRLHNPTNTNTNNNNGKKSPTTNKDQDAKKGGKPRQDKRLYASDPHQGPRPTDWMLSEETIRSRNARDARFAQIVAMGLTKGRTKAGWAQARRPGKRDRDAAKRKLREMEEENERERLKALLDEGKGSVYYSGTSSSEEHE